LFGVLQGITEWLPISSQGQTVLVSLFFVFPSNLALDISIWFLFVFLFLVIVYFRRDLINIFSREERYLLRFLLISTVFTALIGAPLYFLLAEFFAQSAGEVIIGIVGVFLIVSGLVQKKAEGKTKTEREAGDKDSMIAGLLQGFAALPGISRSGITTSALLLRGYSAKSALRLSFMMSVFAVAAAEMGLQVRGGFEISTEAIVSMVVAFAVGLVTIDLFLRLARRVRFWKFLLVLGGLSLSPLLIYLFF
jgi:undecaprenyl-diphosphatase